MVRKLNLVLFDSPARPKSERPPFVRSLRVDSRIPSLTLVPWLRLTIGSSNVPHSPLFRRSYQDRQPSSMTTILQHERCYSHLPARQCEINTSYHHNARLFDTLPQESQHCHHYRRAWPTARRTRLPHHWLFLPLPAHENEVPLRVMQYESQAVVSTAKVIMSASTERFANMIGPYTGAIKRLVGILLSLSVLSLRPSPVYPARIYSVRHIQ